MSREAATELGRKFRSLKGEAAAHASAVLEDSRCSSRAFGLSGPAAGLISSADWLLNSTDDDDGDVSPEALLMLGWLSPLFQVSICHISNTDRIVSDLKWKYFNAYK